MAPRRRTARSGERGETLIEFAFASVIFFMMIFGALEFGIAVWNYNLVSDLAQEGARYAAVHGQNSGSPKTESDVATYVASRASGLPITTTTPLGPPGGKVAGTIVQVQVLHTLALGGGLLPFWNFPVQSQASMMITR
jgi:Flp pilus assembly protein TadG